MPFSNFNFFPSKNKKACYLERSNYLNETVNEPIVYPFIDGDRSDRSPPGNHERSPTQNRKAALHLLVIKYNYVSLWLSDFPRAVPFLV